MIGGIEERVCTVPLCYTAANFPKFLFEVATMRGRRSFLKAVASFAPAVALHDVWGQLAAAPHALALHPVGAGEDRFGHAHTLGFSSLAFKVVADETRGGLFIIEHRNLLPGGPPLHLHPHQEEWFCVMEGAVVFQVGEQRVQLRPGESILAPRAVPHTFSAVHDASRLLIAFCPAGKMEQYFLDAEKHPDQAAQAEFMDRYDMQWVGPSPFWKS